MEGTIKLFNPKVVKLDISLVSTRQTRTRRTVRLKEPYMMVNAIIEVTEPLTTHIVYIDEHNNKWIAMETPTDTVRICNVQANVKGFKMPSELTFFFSTQAEGSTQPLPNNYMKRVRNLEYPLTPDKCFSPDNKPMHEAYLERFYKMSREEQFAEMQRVSDVLTGSCPICHYPKTENHKCELNHDNQ